MSDIAPEHFLTTEYYRQYFAQYVSVDEVQYNVQLDEDRTLCISFGSNVRYSPEQITTLDIIKPWVLALMHQRMCFEIDVEKTSMRHRPGRRQLFNWAARSQRVKRTCSSCC